MIPKIKYCLVEALFPRRCPVCDEIVLPKSSLICAACFSKLSFVRQPVCKKCGKEVLNETQEYCFDCMKHRRSFEYGLALLNYDDQMKHSMAQIKYHNKREYLDFYTEAISGRYWKQVTAMSADALVPIPIHPTRRHQRGFNQAEILAIGLGEKWRIPVCSELLVRNKKTAPQKKLDPMQRLKNLEQAFSIGNNSDRIDSVILVDDIYTTGSTIEACTRVLKKAGILRVYFIVICIGRGSV